VRQHSSLRSVRGVLFDMDGVIYVGNQPLPGVQEAFDYLAETGRKWLFVTNNASQTSIQFVEKLAKMNLRVEPEQVLGSAEATACWLAKQVHGHGWKNGPVIVMGQAGLKTALTNYGFDLTTDPDQAAYAVVGINFEMTYDDLANVTLAIQRGARFIGTNADVTYPSERGPLPGAGSILALLATATGQQPLVIGKPNAGMYEQAMARLALCPAETLMVGDRYDTDIAGAISLGIQTAGILTGVTSRIEFEQAIIPPQLIVNDLPDLVEIFRQSDNHK